MSRDTAKTLLQAWCVVLPSNTGGALSALAPLNNQLVWSANVAHSKALAALYCAAAVLLSDAARLDRGSSAALVELAQLLVVGHLLRSLFERQGLQQRPPWCLSTSITAVCRSSCRPCAVLLSLVQLGLQPSAGYAAYAPGAASVHGNKAFATGCAMTSQQARLALGWLVLQPRSHALP